MAGMPSENNGHRRVSGLPESLEIHSLQACSAWEISWTKSWGAVAVPQECRR